jgi:hypothetical protein
LIRSSDAVEGKWILLNVWEIGRKDQSESKPVEDEHQARHLHHSQPSSPAVPGSLLFFCRFHVLIDECDDCFSSCLLHCNSFRSSRFNLCHLFAPLTAAVVVMVVVGGSGEASEQMATAECTALGAADAHQTFVSVPLCGRRRPTFCCFAYRLLLFLLRLPFIGDTVSFTGRYLFALLPRPYHFSASLQGHHHCIRFPNRLSITDLYVTRDGERLTQFIQDSPTDLILMHRGPVER